MKRVEDFWNADQGQKVVSEIEFSNDNMLAIMGPLTRTGREYKNVLIAQALCTFDNKTVELEHCRLEVECDTQNII